MKLKVLGVLILFMLTISANAETLKNEAATKGLCERIMKKVSKSDLEGVFDLMKPYAVISEEELQSISLQSKTQREQLADRLGKSIGYEFINSKKVGQSLMMYQYIEKTEKHALNWNFYFYRTKDGWVLNSFNWNDHIPNLFLD